MEIKMHYLPELPEESCEVLVIYGSKDSTVSGITNVGYSAKHKLFNYYDFMDPEERAPGFPQNDIVCWAYMDDIAEAVRNEI